jgi:periplasmic divalent cation tolerance protein
MQARSSAVAGSRPAQASRWSNRATSEPIFAETPMNETDPVLMVHTTCVDRAEAERLAAALVDERLAACASIGQEVVSVFPWQDRIEQERETPLTLKTSAAAYPDLAARLVELHSYDVPEVLAVTVSEGHRAYIDWLREWVAGRSA